jgi:hypothetical protein
LALIYSVSKADKLCLRLDFGDVVEELEQALKKITTEKYKFA